MQLSVLRQAKAMLVVLLELTGGGPSIDENCERANTPIKNKWLVRLKSDGKMRSFGYFASLDEAKSASKNALLSMSKEAK